MGDPHPMHNLHNKWAHTIPQVKYELSQETVIGDFETSQIVLHRYRPYGPARRPIWRCGRQTTVRICVGGT